MKGEDEWKEFFRQEAEKMDVDSSQFLANHVEIMSMIEAVKKRNNSKRKKGGKYNVC